MYKHILRTPSDFFPPIVDLPSSSTDSPTTMPTAAPAPTVTREWIWDTGSAKDLAARERLTDAQTDDIREAADPLALNTANGGVRVDEETRIPVLALGNNSGAMAEPMIMPSTSPFVLSAGLRCRVHGYDFHWPAYAERPILTLPDGTSFEMTTRHDVPYIRDSVAQADATPSQATETLPDSPSGGPPPAPLPDPPLEDPPTFSSLGADVQGGRGSVFELSAAMQKELLDAVDAYQWPDQTRAYMSGTGRCLGLTVNRHGPVINTDGASGKRVIKAAVRALDQGGSLTQDLIFTSLQINVDSVAKKHTDANNVGLSVNMAVGDYTGGLFVDATGCATDIKGKGIIIDGTTPHRSTS